MSKRDVAIEELVARARAGQLAASAELFDLLAEDMQQAAEVELKAINDSRDPREVWNTVRLVAETRFVEFEGDSAADVTRWLHGSVLREIRRPPPERDGGSGPGFETLGPSGPNAAGYETIAPSSATKPPAADPLTIRGSSDKTHVGESREGKAPVGEKPVDPLATAVDLNATIAPKSPTKSSASSPASDLESVEGYEILSEIVRGGMGVVYKAKDRKLKRVVGLKMILAGQLANTEDIERFYIEAQAAAILRHKNIVGIHQVGEDKGRHYFSMDFIEGKSLADMIEGGPLDPLDAARYIRKVAAAIQYAHDLDVLHRDLKPSNVLVDQRDEPLVTDFGLAKRTRQEDPVGPGALDPSGQTFSSMVTMAGAIMGTPGYMPPEQAAGKVNEITARSDVYSLGATLYDLVTGRPPIVGKDVWDTVKRVQEEDPVPPRELNPNISLDLDAICLKCLARDPESRYATAQELAEDLERFLADMPVTARQASRAEHAWRWCRRNPWPSAAIAIFLSGFVVSLFLFVRAEGARQREETAHQQTEFALARADASIDQMRSAIEELYEEVANQGLLNNPELKEFRRNLLGRARQLYQQALDRLGDDPKLKEDLAGAQFTLARIVRELDSPTEALDILNKALLTQQELLEESPDDVDRIQALGDTFNLRGEIRSNMKQLIAALADLEQARDLRQRLVPPLSPAIVGQLNTEDQGRATHYERLLINSRMNCGNIHLARFDEVVGKKKKQSHYDSALAEFIDAQTRRESLLVRMPNSARLHQDQAKGYFNLAKLSFLPYQELMREVDDIQTSLPDLVDEIETIKKRSKMKPETTSTPDGQRLAELTAKLKSLDGTAKLKAKQADGHKQEARQYVEMAIEGFKFLLAGKSLEGIGELELARIKYHLALCLLLKSNVTQQEVAMDSLEQARAILEKLVQEDPRTHDYGAGFAKVHELIGEQHFLLFTPEGDQAALKAYDRAIELWRLLPIGQFGGNLTDAVNRRADILDMVGPAATRSP